MQHDELEGRGRKWGWRDKGAQLCRGLKSVVKSWGFILNAFKSLKQESNMTQGVFWGCFYSCVNSGLEKTKGWSGKGQIGKCHTGDKCQWPAQSCGNSRRIGMPCGWTVCGDARKRKTEDLHLGFQLGHLSGWAWPEMPKTWRWEQWFRVKKQSRTSF